MPQKILFLLPAADHDPTESAVIWQDLTAAGIEVHFATPAGKAGHADQRLTQQGFGLLNPLLMTRAADQKLYQAMAQSAAFNAPLCYADVDPADYDGLHIPGGHAAGMRTLLESTEAQRICLAFFTADKPIAAVCHGVLLPARTIDPHTKRSVLFGRKTTGLPASMELSAWLITKPWLGDYYRTYPQTVAGELKLALADPTDYSAGPLLSRRDSADQLAAGFIVTDRNYLSARWPGDCHKLAKAFCQLVLSKAHQ